MLKYVSDDNFLIYAAQYYENSGCVTEKDFYDDLGRIKSIHKIFNRYETTGILNERLVLNHLILLYNVFDRDAITKILVFRLREYIHILKPFLILLNYWPEVIKNVGALNINVIGSNIKMDAKIVELLRGI